jgi:hypothetical protein
MPAGPLLSVARASQADLGMHRQRKCQPFEIKRLAGLGHEHLHDEHVDDKSHRHDRPVYSGDYLRYLTDCGDVCGDIECIRCDDSRVNGPSS